VAQEVRNLAVGAVVGVDRHCTAAETEEVGRETWWTHTDLLVNRPMHYMELQNWCC
jgi:hypothetical protein